MLLLLTNEHNAIKQGFVFDCSWQIVVCYFFDWRLLLYLFEKYGILMVRKGKIFLNTQKGWC